MNISRVLRTSFALLIAAPYLAAQTTKICSVTSSGTLANASSSATALPSVSGDGRWVAFESNATNLTAGDTNQGVDIFVHDLQTGVTLCASVDPSGAVGNHDSLAPSISSDGRFVAFYGGASNLVANDTNFNADVFVRDLQTGTTELVSQSALGVHGNSGSLSPSISADGRYIAFDSASENLDPNDHNFSRDIFVRDRVANTTTVVSVSTAGVQPLTESTTAAISADGRWVAFVSLGSNLVPGDTNNTWDVFLRDLVTQTTTRVSVDSSGAEANGSSLHPSISGDGRFIAFDSRATNLIAGDTNGVGDVFVHDRVTGVTRRVSVSSTGTEATAMSLNPSLSADGRWAAFQSDAQNLVPGDTNFRRDVFVRDLQSLVTTREGLTFAGTQASDGSFNPAISADGRFLGFVTFSADVLPSATITAWHVFLRDRQSTSTAFCFGDGASAPCPCANSGAVGFGCDNSSNGVLGAQLTSGETPSLSADTLTLGVTTNLSPSTCILLQGDVAIAPVAFGDGLRCVAGNLLRLYLGGTPPILFPHAGDPSISARSAALGDTIAPGSVRYYQAYYRDASTTFCARPTGDTFNVTNGLSVIWQ